MIDYNNIMETLERELIGRDVKVSVYVDGPDIFEYVSRFENAWYDVDRVKSKITLEDITGNKQIREGIIKAKRVEADTSEMESEVETLHLQFSSGKIELNGNGLDLGTVYDYSLPNPADSGVYSLGDGLDNGLMIRLQLNDKGQENA